MTDELPEFTRGMVEGEARVRLACDFCGKADEISVMVPERLRDEIATLIEQSPEDMLAAARTACGIAAGWHQSTLPDGGTVDICSKCFERGDWLKL